MLLQVATAYSELLRAEGRRAARIQARDEARVVAKLTADYAKAGQGRIADANRAATVLANWEASIQAAEAEILTASARLCQLVNLDPSIRLHPTDAVVVPQPLVPDPMPLVRADRAGIAPPARAGGAARRDRGGAALPGRGQDPALLAQLPARLQRRRVRRRQQPGPADLRRIQRPRGPRRRHLLDDPEPRAGQHRPDPARPTPGSGSTSIEQVEILNMVRAEIAEAYARTHARYAQIGVYEEAVRSGYLAFHEDLDRIRLMVGAEGTTRVLPIELLNSFNLLADARLDYIDAIIDYNESQFAMYVALGQPPADALARPVPTEGVAPANLPPARPHRARSRRCRSRRRRMPRSAR